MDRDRTDRRRRVVCVTWIALAFVAVAGRADVGSLVGPWEGTLEAPGTSVEIYVDLDAGQDGSISGRLTIPALGIKDQALSEVTLQGDRFTVGIPDIPGDAHFDGVVSDWSSSSSSSIISPAHIAKRLAGEWVGEW